MARFRRTERLNEQFRQEIAELIHGQVRDPHAGMATVTAVETSPELDHAKVYVTALGDDAEKEQVVEGLRRAAGFIRTQLGRRLHIRRVPEIHFVLDTKLEEAMRIESLLRQALPPDHPEADAPDAPEDEA
jgi:ribosome-binding factor A